MQKVNNQQKQQVQARAEKTRHSSMSKGKGTTDPNAISGAGSKESSEAAVKPIHREGPKIGRNDVCPCGSGKKYKKCCLE